MMDLVSVIIPAYNAEKYISETIESVLKQTYKNLEIIIVDDGSTDDTERVVNNKLQAFSKYKFLKQNNLGPAAARNLGIKNAEGDYIAFLDADDLWLPQKIEKQIRFLKEHPECGLVFTRRKIITPYGKVIDDKRKIPKEINFYILVASNYITTSSVMVRKKIFDLCGYFDEDIKGPEDWDMWIRISKCTKIGFIDEPLVIYREILGSLSKRSPAEFEKNQFKVFEKHVLYNSLLPKKVIKKVLYQLYFDSGMRYYVCGFPEEARKRIIKSAKYRITINSIKAFLKTFLVKSKIIKKIKDFINEKF
jgi:glycosyltransferase involved in cell wall biosynthesis